MTTEVLGLLVLGMAIVVIIQSAQLRIIKLDLINLEDKIGELRLALMEQEEAIDLVSRRQRVHEELHHDQ